MQVQYDFKMDYIFCTKLNIIAVLFENPVNITNNFTNINYTLNVKRF